MRATSREAFFELLAAEPGFLERGLACGSGHAFLEWYAEALALGLGTDHVMVGELTGGDWEMVRTLVVRSPNGIEDNFTYSLEGTPCADLVTQHSCCYPRDVSLTFPGDRLLTQAGVKSYVGKTLFDLGGHPLGLVVVMDSNELEPAEVRVAEAVMEFFHARAEAELQRRRAAGDLGTVFEAVAQPSTDRVLPDLVRSLAHALQVDTIWVARPCGEDGAMRSVVAIASMGHEEAPFEYPLSGNPGDDVLPGGLKLVIREARAAYATSRPLEDFHAESVCCRSLTNSDGERLGELVIVHSRPMRETLAEQPIFDVFASLFEAELERASVRRGQVRMERKLQETQQMEALGGLAGGIAHDFNNLLAAILGFAELGSAECDPDSAVAVSLRQIDRASQRAAELCRQMLDYAGRRMLSLQDLEWNALIADMAELLRASIPKKVRLEFDFQEPTPVVAADPAPLRQVVMNLITNAADAMGEGSGCIRLRTASVPVGPGRSGEWLESGNYALLEVRDDGRGMDEGTRRRIFDPFFTTKAENGHGLGLAAVRGILRQHGGAILVSSVAGQGTCVQVYVPLAAQQTLDACESGDAPRTRALQEAGSARVLIADDESMVREVARVSLERAGFDVTCAHDGEDALRIFSADPRAFDLLLLDLSMPGLDGIQTLRGARALRPEIPVVLASGYLFEGVSERLAESEVHSILEKPFRSQALIDAVVNALADRASDTPRHAD